MIAWTCSATSGRDVNILDTFRKYPCSLIGRLVLGFRAGSSVSVRFWIPHWRQSVWLCLLGCSRRGVRHCILVVLCPTRWGQKDDLLQLDPFIAYA
jgi:hypothetical protein